MVFITVRLHRQTPRERLNYSRAHGDDASWSSNGADSQFQKSSWFFKELQETMYPKGGIEYVKMFPLLLMFQKPHPTKYQISFSTLHLSGFKNQILTFSSHQL